jgi:hypothetical protein
VRPLFSLCGGMSGRPSRNIRTGFGLSIIEGMDLAAEEVVWALRTRLGTPVATWGVYPCVSLVRRTLTYVIILIIYNFLNWRYHSKSSALMKFVMQYFLH